LGSLAGKLDGCGPFIVIVAPTIEPFAIESQRYDSSRRHSSSGSRRSAIATTRCTSTANDVGFGSHHRKIILGEGPRGAIRQERIIGTRTNIATTQFQSFIDPNRSQR
jgi:hypothetical protein